MKIALTTRGHEMSSGLDPHFGRARAFIVADTETGEWTLHDNVQNLNAAQGAGIQAAESVVRLGAQAVITGNVGPKAFRVLNDCGVGVFLAQESGTVADALEAFKTGKLESASGATKEGHWV